IYSFLLFLFFFFNDTATTEIYTLSLHDALPISRGGHPCCSFHRAMRRGRSQSCFVESVDPKVPRHSRAGGLPNQPSAALGRRAPRQFRRLRVSGTRPRLRPPTTSTRRSRARSSGMSSASR